jgi:UDP-N-acetylmuramate: L-alanyl-gamma-D-glutamyl-meso-diaminopimelate ligase
LRIHFIAIGGSVMHNLAIALFKQGHLVTGSDDEIFEPAKSRLEKYGLLPSLTGWNPQIITPELDAVILGMHAQNSNPELIRAKESGIHVYSFPEYLFEQTKNKKRIVIAGSHGKTTVTSMIMHVLKDQGLTFDYMVGSIIDGFDTMVELSEDNKIAVFEGDEYLTSPIDPRPKFHLYKPHISLITGIAWDHMNVFPDVDKYVEQFRIFAGMTSESLIYFNGDPLLADIAENEKERIELFPYDEILSCADGKKSLIEYKNMAASLEIFGRHNMQNLAGAMRVCTLIGINEKDFLFSITSFKGAAKRQEHIAGNENHDVYLDFAHAPSKVKATVEAFRQQFPNRKLIACLELHTFSSLNTAFLPQYKESLKLAHTGIVFYDPQVVRHKKLPAIEPASIREAFERNDLIVLTNREHLETEIMNQRAESTLLLIMTSGNFSGIDIRSLAERYIPCQIT